MKTENPEQASRAPRRVRLSRARGWRMPPDTVKVDRSTKWGNPFVVGRHGPAARCVQLFGWLVKGRLLCASLDEACADAQVALLALIDAGGLEELRGKNLACWCREGRPCHADVLLEVANRKGGEV